MKYYGRNQLGTVSVDNPDSYMTNPYPKGFEKVDVPEGVSGDWAIERLTITREKVALYNLRLIRDGRRDRVVPEGTYTRLVRNDGSERVIVMSDTPAEANEHRMAWYSARDHVLINGLGLGFYLAALLRKDTVDRITVVEASEDVINLVGPSFESFGDRVEIVHADAFSYQPPAGQRYGFVWHDIWDTICTDNRPQMTKLRRKYARRTDHQRCWSEEYL